MDKRFQLLIYDSTGGSVETTITADRLADAPAVGGQQVEVLKGRTISQPWKVRVSDIGNYFSNLIADSGGRMVLLRRRCDIQVSVNGSTYATIASSRISDIADHVSDYELTLDDERMLERTFRAFTQQQATTYAIDNGTSGLYGAANVIPLGLQANFGGIEVPEIIRFSSGELGSTGNYKVYSANTIGPLLDPGGPFRPKRFIWASEMLTPDIVRLVKDDLTEVADYDPTSTVGNFKTLRARVTSTSGTADYEVAGISRFNYSPALRPWVLVQMDADRFVEVGEAQKFSSPFLMVAIVSTGSFTAVDSLTLYMPTHEPTPTTPLLIGGSDGIHPFELVRDLYDEAGVRYSTGLTDLINNKEYQTAWWRITKPAILSEWLEDNIYKPYGVIPFINNAGAVHPVSIRLPRSSDVADDITTLPLITETEAAIPHPTWRHGIDKQITRCRFVYETYEHADAMWTASTEGTHDWSDYGADLLKPTEQELIKTHDRSTEFGIHDDEFLFMGLHREQTIIIPGFYGGQGYSRYGVDHWAEKVSQDVFQRVGDGSIEGTISLLSTAHANIAPGDYFRIQIPTFPDPQNRTRGGTRIVQATNRVYDVPGPDYEWLDAGNAIQPTSAPTITLAAATSDQLHTVKATIANLTTAAGAKWELMVAKGGSLPTEGSSLWLWAGASSGASYNIRALPSGQNIHARVRSAVPGRIRSAWSTAATQATCSLTAASALATSSVTGAEALLSWSLGSTGYPVRVFLEASATCPSSGVNAVDANTIISPDLPPGSVRYRLTGMTNDTTQCVGVHHFDPYGGYSTMATLSFATTGAPTAPSILNVVLVHGST